MFDHKLTSILASLSKKEMKWFSQFSATGYFNRNEDVIKLVELFRQHHPNYDVVAFDKERVFEHLYPSTVYDEQELYNQISFTYRLLQKFLAVQQLESEPAMMEHYFLRTAQERNLNRNFQLAYAASTRKMEQMSHRSSEYYYQKYLLEGDADNFYIQQEERGGGGHLQEKVDHLDIFYFTEKLKNYCEMLNRKNIVNKEYELHFTTELTAIIDQKPALFHDIPSIAIYFAIYSTLTDTETPAHYTDLIALLNTHAMQFPRHEAREMFNYAQNYCIKRINQGQSEYLNEIFHVYEQLLQTAIIFDGDHITQWDYKNIITVSTRLKKFDWTSGFIEEYRAHLAPAYRENAYLYNLSNFHYAKGDWKQALKVLQEVEFSDVYYHLSGKSLLLKIYFEQDETEALLSLFEAFKTFLKRNKKVSAYQKKVHLNLIRYAQKANRLKRPARITEKYKQEVITLRDEITQVGEITNVAWLKSQVEGLLARD